MRRLLILLAVITAICDMRYAICEQLSSGELIGKAWEAHGRRDIEATFKYTNQLIELYKEQADSEQKCLKELPKTREEIENVRALNDVAGAYFIQAESYIFNDPRMATWKAMYEEGITRLAKAEKSAADAGKQMIMQPYLPQELRSSGNSFDINILE